MPELRPRLPLWLALAGLLLLLLPFALLRQHSYLLIDDNLDADLSAYYLLIKHHVALDYRATATVPAVMNGLPRSTLWTGLSVTAGAFALLHQPWAAYLAHQALARLAGLLGMYALLCGPLLLGQRRGLAAALALAWATIPTYTIFGTTVLGQPALLLAFLALRRGPARWWPWLVVAGFAFWSTFALVGPFVLVVLGGGLLWDWHRTRQLNRRVAAGIVLLLGAYVVVEWPVFYTLLVARPFVPHRVEFDLARLAPLSWRAGLRSTVQFLVWGQYHAGKFLRVSAVLAVAGAVACAPAGGRGAVLRQLAPWLLALLGLALVGGFYPQLAGWAQARWAGAGVFNAGRFYFLAPLVYFLLLALAVRALPRPWPAAAVGLQLLAGLAANPECVNNLRALAGQARPHDPSYAAYVAPALFGRVQATIWQQTGLRPWQYRVACLGMAPGVAQLNDFYTLDSYQNYYSLAYKHRFRRIVAAELAKDPALAAYFDAWGNRCYVFSAELGRDFQVGAYQRRRVQHFAFDTAAFRGLGGRYLLSAAELAAPGRSGLRLVQVFEQPGAYWRIWLYEAPPARPRAGVLGGPGGGAGRRATARKGRAAGRTFAAFPFPASWPST